jgi:hypothetical protein
MGLDTPSVAEGTIDGQSTVRKHYQTTQHRSMCDFGSHQHTPADAGKAGGFPARTYRARLSLAVSAPSEAWRFLPGESPGQERDREDLS